MNRSEVEESPVRSRVVRRHIRFKPGLACYASIDPVPDRKAFSPSIVALVLDEAYSGCGLVALSSAPLKAGDVCRVQVGTLAPIRAEVRWRRQLDPDVMRFSLRYLD